MSGPNSPSPISRTQMLNAFLLKDEGPEYYRHVLFIDGWLCATNGKNVLAFPEKEPSTDAMVLTEQSMYSHVRPVLLKHITAMQGVRVSSGGLPPLSPPPRPEKIVCRECRGDGEVTFDNEFNEYTCTCLSCDGSGGSWPPHVMTLPGGSQHYPVWSLHVLRTWALQGVVEATIREQYPGLVFHVEGGGLGFLGAVVAPTPPAAA